jgi:hypothetical protein
MRTGRRLIWCEWKFEHEKEELPMKYTQPKITQTYPAFSVIKSMKGQFVEETGSILLTNGPAYQSEE